jgi:hypothetical protein
MLIGVFVAALAASPGANALIILTNENTLTINLAGTGGGQVNFVDNGGVARTCTPTCTEEYVWNIFGFPDVPTLTAVAAAGSTFTGWTVAPAGAVVSGCGPTSITCTVDMGFNDPNGITATATFAPAPNTFPLTVLKAGTGTGTVTSTPAGIDCGADCSESYAQGSVITLTATPTAGSTFTGWSGACTGTGSCVVTMNGSQSVTATFDTQTFALTVTVEGNGGVSSSPAGIACPDVCTASFPQGTVVTLTAQTIAQYEFQGWEGAGCTGTGTCVVTMNSAQSVTATFTPAPVQATVVGQTIRKTGPPGAVRQLRVTVNAEEHLARIVLRIRRGGVTIQSRTIRDFDPDTAVLRMNIRNGVAAGRAQLNVTFTNDVRTQKVQNRGISIPRR